MIHFLKIFCSTYSLIYSLIYLLNACLPIPHREYRAPKISGIIFDGNTPLKQTKIYLSSGRDEQCSKYEMVVTTTDFGAFEIGPISKVEFLVFLLGDPVVFWNMCIDHDSERRVLLSQRGIGISPKIIQVKCNVSKNEKEFIKAYRHMEGYCTVTDP